MKIIKFCRDYSLPLILGVIVSLIWANCSESSYHAFIHTPIFGEEFSLHMIINDIFMVFFFAIAGVEIINSMSKGGALNPIKNAVTPLMATFGGVLMPIAVFFILNALFGSPEYTNGWGACTPTDIAMAWLIAKLTLGDKHPAISFLLLLAVVDDAIGLVIIAVFYPDPSQPVEPIWLLLVLAAMGLAFIFNRLKIRSFLPYILICGAISWFGMHNAHLHPALALIFIMPFLPRTGVVIPAADEHGVDDAVGDSTLHSFEKKVGGIVDFGLFFFGLTSAGVTIAGFSNLTVIIFFSFLIGKCGGICLFTWIATLFKAGLPKGMKRKDVFITSVIAGMGLTVALFIAESAFLEAATLNSAKMGALLTILVLPISFILGKVLKIKKVKDRIE